MNGTDRVGRAKAATNNIGWSSVNAAQSRWSRLWSGPGCDILERGGPGERHKNLTNSYQKSLLIGLRTRESGSNLPECTTVASSRTGST